MNPPLLIAMVTHVSAQEIGLKMIDFGKEVYRIIYAFYKEQQIPLKRSLVGIESSGMKFQRTPITGVKASRY